MPALDDRSRRLLSLRIFGGVMKIDGENLDGTALRAISDELEAVGNDLAATLQDHSTTRVLADRVDVKTLQGDASAVCMDFRKGRLTQ